MVPGVDCCVVACPFDIAYLIYWQNGRTIYTGINAYYIYIIICISIWIYVYVYGYYVSVNMQWLNRIRTWCACLKHASSDRNSGYLLYIGDYTTQLFTTSHCTDPHEPISISWNVIGVFFLLLTWHFNRSMGFLYVRNPIFINEKLIRSNRGEPIILLMESIPNNYLGWNETL